MGGGERRVGHLQLCHPSTTYFHPELAMNPGTDSFLHCAASPFHSFVTTRALRKE